MCQGFVDGVFVTPMLAPQLTLGSGSVKPFSLYESCVLAAPDGEFLCKCHPMKAAWYIEQGLGDVVSAEGEEFKVS